MSSLQLPGGLQSFAQQLEWLAGAAAWLPQLRTLKCTIYQLSLPEVQDPSVSSLLQQLHYLPQLTSLTLVIEGAARRLPLVNAVLHRLSEVIGLTSLDIRIANELYRFLSSNVCWSAAFLRHLPRLERCANSACWRGTMSTLPMRQQSCGRRLCTSYTPGVRLIGRLTA